MAKQDVRRKASARAIAVNATLAVASVLAAVFMVDGAIGRYVFFGTTYKQAPNARYTYANDSFSFDVRLNSDGFRDSELPTKPFATGKRVVFLGDSMTFGWGVDAKHSFVRVAEDLLREADGEAAWEFINLGVEGTAPFDYRDNLLAFGAQLEPDMVVLCYYAGNDAVSSAPPPRKDVRRPRFHEDLMALRPRNLATFVKNRLVPPGERPLYAMPGTRQPNPLVEYLGSSDPAVQARVEAIRPAMREKALNWQVNPYLVAGSVTDPNLLAWQIRQGNETMMNPAGRIILEEVRVACERLGAELRVVLIPAGYTVNKVMWPSLEEMGYMTPAALLFDRRFQDAVQHYARVIQVPVLDLLPALCASPEATYFETDPHLTEAGNHVVAKAMAEWLAREGAVRLAQAGIEMPPMESVHTWRFSSAAGLQGWRLNAQDSSSEVGAHGWRILSGDEELRLLNPSVTLDAARVNRLRVRMKADRGRFGRLFWGHPPGDTSDAYPFSADRIAPFPILADGTFHEYDVALDHAVADWQGEWNLVRLDPACLHEREGTMDGAEIIIESIALGYCTPEAKPPDAWAQVEMMAYAQRAETLSGSPTETP
ncbi:MAG TPA: GDSL-type esterase/lipase family protein [Candidatus Hydrogenedentes bacterium]|nr:GDSL-type esterase/lipase family protein [Candidatus Hydrogenedentota bacterium]HPG68027.1 GDSL-type esterase/lipase family protein [Candidatus Hydrogenedentota bacterium]